MKYILFIFIMISLTSCMYKVKKVGTDSVKMIHIENEYAPGDTVWGRISYGNQDELYVFADSCSGCNKYVLVK